MPPRSISPMSKNGIDSKSNASGPSQHDQSQIKALSKKQLKKLARKEVVITEESASTFDFLLANNIRSVEQIQALGQEQRNIVEYNILENATKNDDIMWGTALGVTPAQVVEKRKVIAENKSNEVAQALVDAVDFAGTGTGAALNVSTIGDAFTQKLQNQVRNLENIEKKVELFASQRKKDLYKPQRDAGISKKQARKNIRTIKDPLTGKNIHYVAGVQNLKGFDFLSSLTNETAIKAQVVSQGLAKLGAGISIYSIGRDAIEGNYFDVVSDGFILGLGLLGAAGKSIGFLSPHGVVFVSAALGVAKLGYDIKADYFSSPKNNKPSTDDITDEAFISNLKVITEISENAKSGEGKNTSLVDTSGKRWKDIFESDSTPSDNDESISPDAEGELEVPIVEPEIPATPNENPDEEVDAVMDEYDINDGKKVFDPKLRLEYITSSLIDNALLTQKNLKSDPYGGAMLFVPTIDFVDNTNRTLASPDGSVDPRSLDLMPFKVPAYDYEVSGGQGTPVMSEALTSYQFPSDTFRFSDEFRLGDGAERSDIKVTYSLPYTSDAVDVITNFSSNFLRIQSTKIPLPRDKDLSEFFNGTGKDGMVPSIPVTIEITAPPGSQRLGGYLNGEFFDLGKTELFNVGIAFSPGPEGISLLFGL